MKIKHFLLLASFFIAILGFSQIDNQQIATALKTGNATEVSKHFSSRVELNLQGEINNYSKAAAESVLFDFFEENQPTAYRQVHSGEESNIDYVIGILSTENGDYQISYYLIKTGEKYQINQFIIALEEDE